MNETEMIDRIVRAEERGKSNTKRLDEHDKRLDELEKTYSIMEKMDYRMGKVEIAVDNIDKKLDEQQGEKGKKWDKLIDYIFYAILGLLLGYIAIRLRIK